ncbi:unnamed protein product [Amoebophrya sp. A120]|nr:unnamed protein product [Amoebophrya sp. A120]|eukprot:GSA120T00022678001.1
MIRLFLRNSCCSYQHRLCRLVLCSCVLLRAVFGLRMWSPEQGKTIPAGGSPVASTRASFSTGLPTVGSSDSMWSLISLRTDSKETLAGGPSPATLPSPSPAHGRKELSLDNIPPFSLPAGCNDVLEDNPEDSKPKEKRIERKPWADEVDDESEDETWDLDPFARVREAINSLVPAGSSETTGESMPHQSWPTGGRGAPHWYEVYGEPTKHIRSTQVAGSSSQVDSANQQAEIFLPAQLQRDK